MNLNIKKFISSAILLTLMSGCNGSDNDVSSISLSSDEAKVENTQVSYKYKLNTKVSSNSIRLFWNYSDNVEHYELVIKKNKEEVDSIELSENELEYRDYNVEETVLYSYELSAYDKAGDLVNVSTVNAHINESRLLHSDEAI